MTLILMVATFAVLTCLGVSCRRARLDLEEQLCECLPVPVAAPVSFRSAAPALTRIDGGREAAAVPADRSAARHLWVVGAG